MMYKHINISIYLNILSLLNVISTTFLEAESNYVSYLKPKLERNNIVNKGLWIRNNKNRKYTNDFIFRANSLDDDSLHQNSFDPFRQNMVNSAFFTGFNMERNKRSVKDKLKLNSLKKTKCSNKSNCMNIDSMFIGDSKIISTLKPSSIFDDYPYEVTVILNNNKDHREKFEKEVGTHHKDGLTNKIHIKKNITKNYTKVGNPSTINNSSSSTNRSNVIPKRNMSRREYESEVIKKIEFIEDINSTDYNMNKIDKNMFDKDEMAWHYVPTPNLNVYKTLPQKIEKNKPINERGMLKVLSLLTKTFKQIMKKHQDIKRIHNKLHDLNDKFTKNTEVITGKFEDFNSKYLIMVNPNQELKTMEAKLKEREQKFNNREKDLSKNLKEFEKQQKQFLSQQQQFYYVQKLMLAQNEKINLKQNVIAKTQSEISQRQNNFARILKKAKQIYIDSRNLTPTKLNKAIAMPKFKAIDLKPKQLNVVNTATPTTTSTLPPPTSTSETVKINLFSIPAFTRLENQDQMILDEKDYQPVDELIYKYYFNNTFIDDLIRSKILATFINNSEGTESNINKDKRYNKVNPMTTLLMPINKTIESNEKHRNRRWIKHSKKNNHKKGFKGSTKSTVNIVPDINDNIVNTDVQNDYSKIGLAKKTDPFTLMALKFCKEIDQSVNVQSLNWCIEKVLRKLKVIDLKLPSMTSDPALQLHTTTPLIITETTSEPKLNQNDLVTTENINAVMFFPDNDELENKLKEYEMKPDTEGTVYYDGSLHASDLEHLGADKDSSGFSDIMPGLDSDSRVQVNPAAFDLQAQRRADVRKMNERIIKMRIKV